MYVHTNKHVHPYAAIREEEGVPPPPFYLSFPIAMVQPIGVKLKMISALSINAMMPAWLFLLLWVLLSSFLLYTCSRPLSTPIDFLECREDSFEEFCLTSFCWYLYERTLLTLLDRVIFLVYWYCVLVFRWYPARLFGYLLRLALCIMVRNGHGVSIRELDNRLYATAMSQKMNSVPGYRTSAGE